MASEDSEWISPRKRYSAPKRSRVNELRQKFEGLADKPFEHQKPGSSPSFSQRHSPVRSHGWGSNDYEDSGSRDRSSQNADPSFEYSDSQEEYDEPSFYNVLESTRIDGRDKEQSRNVDPTIMQFDERAKIASGVGEYDIIYGKIGQENMDWYLHAENTTPPPQKTNQELLDDLFGRFPEFSPEGYQPDKGFDGHGSDRDNSSIGNKKGKKKKEKKPKSKEPKPSIAERIMSMGVKIKLRIGISSKQ